MSSVSTEGQITEEAAPPRGPRKRVCSSLAMFLTAQPISTGPKLRHSLKIQTTIAIYDA